MVNDSYSPNLWMQRFLRKRQSVRQQSNFRAARYRLAQIQRLQRITGMSRPPDRRWRGWGHWIEAANRKRSAVSRRQQLALSRMDASRHMFRSQGGRSSQGSRRSFSSWNPRFSQ
jgi:hypothetical protein